MDESDATSDVEPSTARVGSADSEQVCVTRRQVVGSPMPAEVAVLFTLLMRQMDRLRELSTCERGVSESK